VDVLTAPLLCQTTAPVAGSPLVVRNRNNENHAAIDEIHHAVRELAEDIAMSAVNVGGPALRRFKNGSDRMINFAKERSLRRRASARIPIGGVLDLFRCFEKESDALTYRARR
jgi:hypothetical protein